MIGKIAVSIVGVLLFVFGAYHSRKRRNVIENGEETIAEVYDYQYHMNKKWKGTNYKKSQFCSSMR